MLIKRKKQKDHGTKASYEGAVMVNPQVVILEDVITTGKTVREFIEQLLVFETPVKVLQLITIFDREEASDDFYDFLKANNILYDALYKASEFEDLVLE